MNLKRILASAAIILLLGLYVVTLICAIIKTPFAYQLFRACLYGTFVIPVILYGFMIAVKIWGKKEKDDES